MTAAAQLSLFDPPSHVDTGIHPIPQNGDLLDRLKSLVIEDGMSDAEAYAAAADALERLAPPPDTAAKPCRCEPSGLPLSGESRCLKCGRAPA